MATAFKCDSCGRYFQFGRHEQSGDYYCGWYPKNFNDVEIRADLCLGCYTEFSEFMKKFLNNPLKRMDIKEVEE